MPRSLRARFLAALLVVWAIALSAALALHTLVVRDFRDFLEGQREDRVYWLTADTERAFVEHGGWQREWLAEDALWALQLGFQVRVRDASGEAISDTESVVAALSPAMRDRGLGLPRDEEPRQEYVPYPLFVAGERIGTLEVKRLRSTEGDRFVERSNALLVASVLVLGGLAVVLAAVASRRLTSRLASLAEAAGRITAGDLGARAAVRGRDEVGALADAFNRMAGAVEELERRRKGHLVDLAHDLRTPLASIRGELEGMMDGLIPADRAALQSLHDEVRRLRRMLDAFEELARAQGAALALAKEEVRLAPFLAQVAERGGRVARDKRARLVVRCPEGLVLEADPERLGQVLHNLVDNALKAIGEGGSVTITASGGPGAVEIAVEDDGAGMDPADLPHIFERFFRRSQEGLGIGLAIAKELVEAHGGTIEVSSAPGRGARFAVRLPA